MADFIENFRATMGGMSLPKATSAKTGDIDASGRPIVYISRRADRYKTNGITFRDAEKDEETGLQRITVVDGDGNERDFFLVVPRKKVVGYGGIVPNEDVKLPLGKEGKTTEENLQSGDNIFQAIPNNLITGLRNAQTKSNYRGTAQTPGLGSATQEAGEILGIIDDNGVTHTAKYAKELFDSINNIGEKHTPGNIIGITKVEDPVKTQEHTGPAYIPGDILLSLLGLRANRGAVSYSYPTAQEHSGYQRMMQNLRQGSTVNNAQKNWITGWGGL